MKKRVKGSEVAKKEVENMEIEQEEWRPEASDVMYVKIHNEWKVDDTYKIID